jgi:hypothetical protein
MLYVIVSMLYLYKFISTRSREFSGRFLGFLSFFASVRRNLVEHRSERDSECASRTKKTITETQNRFQFAGRPPRTTQSEKIVRRRSARGAPRDHIGRSQMGRGRLRSLAVLVALVRTTAHVRAPDSRTKGRKHRL